MVTSIVVESIGVIPYLTKLLARRDTTLYKEKRTSGAWRRVGLRNYELGLAGPTCHECPCRSWLVAPMGGSPPVPDCSLTGKYLWEDNLEWSVDGLELLRKMGDFSLVERIYPLKILNLLVQSCYFKLSFSDFSNFRLLLFLGCNQLSV